MSNLMLARATHVPTRSAMILIVADNNRPPVYLKDLGIHTIIDGRRFSEPHADLRFLSKQEEKRFNRQPATPTDWTDASVVEGADARDEALALARAAANPAVASAIRLLFR